MRLLFLFILLVVVSPVKAQVVLQNTNEPTGFQRGFSKNQWAHSLGCMISAYGHTVFTSNAIRCYNPLTDTWKVIFAAGNAGAAEGDQTPGVNPSGRDNENSLYVDNVKRFWVWAGTHGNMSGVFDLSGCAPNPTDGCATLVSAGPGDSIPDIEVGFTGVPAPAPGGGSDSGMAWNKDCDGGVGCALIVGGNGGNADAFIWIIERNTAAQITALGGTSHKYCGDGAGVKPWIVCRFTGTKPPPRNQALGTTVAVGNDFYVGGGQDPDNATQLTDLWKFTRSTNAFSLISNALPGGYQSSVTYDSDLNMIFVNGNPQRFNGGTAQFFKGWDIANLQWVDMSSILADNGIDCRGDAAGAYSPTAHRHLYGGGNYCDGAPHNGASLPQGYNYQVSPSGFYLAAGRLYMAPGLWVTKAYPPFRTVLHNGVIGETGFGISPNGSGIKHQRIRYNPNDGRLWFMHGDWFGGEFSGNFNSQIFSYDMNAPSSTPEASKWRLEWPYCGIGGGEKAIVFQDESPVVLDVTRQKLLYPGGFNSGNARPAADCTGFGIASYFYGNSGAPAHDDAHPPVYLEFDIPTRRFDTRSGFTPHSTETHQGVWNPTTNEIIVPRKDPNRGFSRMSVATGVWTPIDTICATPGPGVLPDSTGGCSASGGNYINDINLINEQLALDVANQVIYIIDTTHGTGECCTNLNPNLRYRLFKYDLATNGVTNYGYISLPYGADTVQTPGVTQPHFCDNVGPVSGAGGLLDCYKFPFYSSPHDSTMLVYDSQNQRLLWPASNNTGSRPILLVFNPPVTGAVATIDPMIRDRPGEALFGTNGTYIPELNVMVMYGGFGWVPGGGYGGDPTTVGEFAHECPACNTPMSYWSMYRLGGTSPLNSIATLTVNSMNPSSGVAITISPNDNNGAGNGTTPGISRAYTIANNTAVTLVAPATAGGNNFSDWSGCDSVGGTGNRTCNVQMTSSKTVAAVYLTTPVNRNLTINSTPSGIAMTLSPSGSCPATPCTISYADSTTVTVTAPLISGLYSYTIWGPGNCNSLAGNVCTVNMTANKTVGTTYASGDSYQNSVDFSNVQGQRDWRYLDSTGAAMTFSNGYWQGNEGSLAIGGGGLSHPGPTKQSMLRWTSPVAGTMRITGNAHDADSGGGDGVDVSVVKNGSTTLLASTTINNGDLVGINLNISVTVAIGDTIDFKVAARANSNFDTTALDPIISPETSGPAITTVTFGAGGKYGASVTFGK